MLHMQPPGRRNPRSVDMHAVDQRNKNNMQMRRAGATGTNWDSVMVTWCCCQMWWKGEEWMGQLHSSS